LFLGTKDGVGQKPRWRFYVSKYHGASSYRVEFYDPDTDRYLGFAPNATIAVKTAIMLSDDKTVQVRDKNTKEVFMTIVNGKVILDK